MRILSCGINEFNMEKFQKPTIDDSWYLNKPRYGLWGSTYTKNDEFPSDWIRWCYQEDFHLNKYEKGISFTLNKNAKILNIDSIDRYISLLIGHHEIMDHRVYYENIISPDWNYIINNYDAVHVECDLIYNCTLRYNMLTVNIDDTAYKANGFYSYDAESWLIINPDCINKGSILNHSIDMKKLELLEG